MNRLIAAAMLVSAVAGWALGAAATLAVQESGGPPTEPRTRPEQPAMTATSPLDPEIFLVWTPGGLPEDFRDRIDRIPGVEDAVVFASDNAWLDRSWSARGEVVDRPPPGYSIPLEVAAVAPGRFARFLPPVDRTIALALDRGMGVLGESSAKLRGLGPGAVLRSGDVRVEVAAILPDELVGAHELLVSRGVGAQLGVTHDRYALVVPEGEADARRVARLVSPLIPSGLVRVRAPGDTPVFRHGDAVLPPVLIKALFGEFAARPSPGHPGYLSLDPSWVRRYIDTRWVPLLGRVTCHVALFPQIRGVVRDLIAGGHEGAIDSFSGCFAARHINRAPTAGISHHSWGIALDVNVAANPFGAQPHQDPALVRTFERWGFTWGGRWVVPDGMHFEYRRPPPS